MGVTIVDVAREAGTSKSTVSKVLRDHPYVSKEARARVLRAIDRLGYRPNRAARSLVQGRARALGIVIPDIRNPFYPRLIRAIDDAAKEAGYTTILAQVDFDQLDLVEEVESVLWGLVDGIIFGSSWGSPSSLRRLKQRSVPFAFVSCKPDDLQADYAVVDDNYGARLAVDHLAGLGHRRIAHIASPEPDSSAQDRLEGYLSGLKNHGLPVDERLIVSAIRRTSVGSPSGLDGYDAAASLMTQASPATAIFCANDDIALRAMEAVEDSGARIPSDVSLVGFDDLGFSAIPRIGLTTVSHPIEQMGRVVTDWILDRAKVSTDRMPLQIVFKPSLVVRTSTAALRLSFPDSSETKASTRPDRLILEEPDHRTLVRSRGELPPGVAGGDGLG